MASLNDINMEGVNPNGNNELPAGEYILRIENTAKTPTKDKFDDSGAPHPDNGKNFYLQVDMKVFNGPCDGMSHIERLNLWNSNAMAVNIAKSTLKAIFLATGVEASDSVQLHSKWLVLEVKPNSKGELKNHYKPCPPAFIPQNAPPLTVHVPAPAATPAAATATAAPAPQAATVATATQPAATDPNALPAWARKA